MCEATETTPATPALDAGTVTVAFQGTPMGDALDGTYTLARLPRATDDDDSDTFNYAAIVCGFIVITACRWSDGWDVNALYLPRGFMFQTKERKGDAGGGVVDGLDGGSATIVPNVLP